jgi:hypothetical protein
MSDIVATALRHRHAPHAAAFASPELFGHVGRGCVEVDDPEGCAAHDAVLPDGSGALLVGERLNVAADQRWSGWSPAAKLEPYATLTNPGAFLWGAARSRLLRCGVRWRASANLLWPERLGAWDDDLARGFAADLLRDPRFLAHPLVWLAGRRPAEAFGVRDWRPLTICTPYPGQVWALLPHPSGTSRFWNARDAARQTRDFVLRTYSELRR